MAPKACLDSRGLDAPVFPELRRVLPARKRNTASLPSLSRLAPQVSQRTVHIFEHQHEHHHYYFQGVPPPFAGALCQENTAGDGSHYVNTPVPVRNVDIHNRDSFPTGSSDEAAHEASNVTSAPPKRDPVAQSERPVWRPTASNTSPTAPQNTKAAQQSFEAARQAKNRLRPKRSPPVRQMALSKMSSMNETQMLWNKYQESASQFKAEMPRGASWDTVNEGQVSLRLEAMGHERGWLQQRTAVRHQFREIAEAEQKGALVGTSKRSLVGDPRLRHHHEGEYIQKLKQEDIEQSRVHTRKIVGVMRDCAKHRQELVRMQRLLQAEEHSGHCRDIGDRVRASIDAGADKSIDDPEAKSVRE